MKQFRIYLLIIISLINPSFELYQNLLLSTNILLMFIIMYLRYHKYYNIQKLEQTLDYLKWIGIYALLALDCTQQQICAQLILLTNLEMSLKFIVSLGSMINSIIEPNQFRYYFTIPYMIVSIIITLYDKWKEEHITIKQGVEEQQTNLVTFKQQKSNQFEKQSHIYQGDLLKSPDVEIVDQPNSPMVMDLQCNEEDDILAQMAWIHNQSIFVYNSNLEVVYQNFFMGKLIKDQSKGSQIDYEQVFLDTTIEIGSREVVDLFGNSEIDLDQDESLLLDSTIHSRYKIKGPQHKIKQMINCLFQNYTKWKFFTFTLFKIKNNILDFNNIRVKVLVTEVKQKYYTLFMFENNQKGSSSRRVLDEPVQFQNVFQTFLSESNNYINTIHLLILLCSHDYEKCAGKVSKEYLKQMRMSTQKFMMFLSTMKDLTLQLTSQLVFRNSTFKVTDILDELQLIFDDCLKIKEIAIVPILDAEMIINNDSERTKQVLKCLFDIAIKFTVCQKIRIDIHQVSPNNFQFQLKDIPIRDDQQKILYQQVLKSTGKLMRTSCKDFDMSTQLELQVAAIIAFLLSGSLRKSLELIVDNNLMGTFVFTVESLPINGKQAYYAQQAKPKKFDTSLSMLLAQAQESSHYRNDESKYLSFTQMSKQQSLKPDQTFDLQSAHFSQISKIKQESPQLPPLSSQHQSNSGTNKVQDSLFPKSINNPSKGVKSDSALQDSSKPPTSALDFGESTTNPNLDLPEWSPKFLKSVIKYKLTNQCCSKVIIADNDYFNVHVLQILLNKYEVKADKAFTQQQTLQLIRSKAQNPCRCKNGAYLLYFIDAYLPSGVELIKEIKQLFRSQQIDRGFIIAMASYSDMELKLSCFNSGIDYFITKPFDLFELTAILQYIQF